MARLGRWVCYRRTTVVSDGNGQADHTIDAPVSGTLLKIVKDRKRFQSPKTIAIVGEPGEDVAALLTDEEPAADKRSLVQQAHEAKVPWTTPDVSGQRRFTTPRARMRAEELRSISGR